ncbi:hypothetical protein [Kitasatospora sp. NPDC001175]|uniref:hypothetical protein n=1 Tax=Kitasatospora sp. NPDC001175 TaxID=3157103 RepID=UPI003CFEE1A7
MPFEDEFASALREVADVSLVRGVDELAVDAARRGRRKKLRRNVIGGAVMVAVVASGAAAVASLPGGRGTTDPAAPASASVSGSPAPTAAASTPAAPVGADQMLSLLKSAIPSGWQESNPDSRSTEPDPKLNGRRAPYAGLTLEDGQGQGSITVNLRRDPTPVDMNADWAKCPDPTYEPYTVCSHTARPDGSYLTVLQRWTHPDKARGFKQWFATLRRPDGAVVDVTEYNMPGQTVYQLTRTDPPLTADQLAAIATDHRWDQVLNALPAAAAPAKTDMPPPNFTSPKVDQILATAAQLLPNGLKESDTGGSGAIGDAHFTVDDGQGKSLIEVIVQDWSGFQPSKFSGADVSTEFKNATTLSDGTKVLSYTEDDFAGHKGIVRNGVDILRPDHLRVLVHSFNSAAPAGQPTRDAPALTLDQLQALATSPAWHGPAK